MEIAPSHPEGVFVNYDGDNLGAAFRTALIYGVEWMDVSSLEKREPNTVAKYVIPAPTPAVLGLFRVVVDRGCVLQEKDFNPLQPAEGGGWTTSGQFIEYAPVEVLG